MKKGYMWVSIKSATKERIPKGKKKDGLGENNTLTIICE